MAISQAAAPAAVRKWRAIALLAVCEVLAMALWFAGSAIIPSLRLAYDLGGVHESLLASSVAVGFVAGTLTSAVLGLADRIDARRLFMLAAFVGAAATGAILLVAPDSWAVVALRFVVGASVAGIYPVGMKIASTWAEADMGLLVGLLVGALTLGSAAPHLIDAFGGVDWRLTLAVASVLALLAGLLVRWVDLGPRLGKAPPFDPARAALAWRQPALRLANLGYLGHMWELYAMWAWIGVFLAESFALRPGGPAAAFWAKVATFAVIGAGAIGCLAGGALADRFGRTTLTMAAMAISGTCALVVGSLFGAAPWLVVAVCVVWGVAVVADSAQFSASVIELAEPSYVGTLLTVQTCAGFLLTVATIHAMPPLVATLGWSVAFAVLAIGPFLGVLAMARLRRRPEARRLAGGRG